MREEKTICDSCKKEVDCFFEIKEGVMKRANGRARGNSMGYRTDEMKDLLFCSTYCFQVYFERVPEEQYQSKDFYFPGKQAISQLKERE